MKNWTQAEAIALCVKIEAIVPEFGAHIALSGGCLYREGERKDCDLILYRIRQAAEIKFEEIFKAFETIGIRKISGFGFCHKLEYEGKKIDMLSPEEEGDEYPQPGEIDKPHPLDKL